MDDGMMDTGTEAHWDIGTMECSRVPGHLTTGQCGYGTMGQWDTGTIDHAAMDNGTMDNATLGQWGRGTMNNGTMDAGTVDSRTMRLWDNEHGTVDHWRITYWVAGPINVCVHDMAK